METKVSAQIGAAPYATDHRTSRLSQGLPDRRCGDQAGRLWGGSWIPAARCELYSEYDRATEARGALTRKARGLPEGLGELDEEAGDSLADLLLVSGR